MPIYDEDLNNVKLATEEQLGQLICKLIKNERIVTKINVIYDM